MAKALVNGVEYSFVDIRVRIGVTEIVGITAIEYNITQEKENIYGAGEQPVSRGRGA
jgi:predicted ATP-grasp superfamily ATP-dependent carboligase